MTIVIIVQMHGKAGTKLIFKEKYMLQRNIVSSAACNFVIIKNYLSLQKGSNCFFLSVKDHIFVVSFLCDS